MTDIDPDRTLASLVEETPACALAFESLGLDYCCDGDRALTTACSQAGLDVDDVRSRLSEARDSDGADETAQLREAVQTFEDDHAATADGLDRVAELTGGYAVPEDACPSYRSMLDRLERLERDTHMHVHKENNVLFPRAAEQLSAGSPVV